MKTKRLLSALILSCLLPLTAFAATWQDPETKVNYEYTVGESEACVKAGSSWSAGSKDVSGDIVILSIISVDGNEYSITSIGNNAFYGCTGLTSVTIPESVNSIGSRVFYNCRNLTSVTIPNSMTSIGESAFYGCSGLTSVTIPNSVTNIGNSTFYGCSGLTSVTIPSSMTSIGNSAFSGCTGLTSIHITDLTAWMKIKFDNKSSNPLAYAKHLFLNDTELTNLVIPTSITSIGNYSFSGCSGLTSVTIPESVTSIGTSAFSDCISLSSVNIPTSVTNINGSAFSGCTSLSSVNIPSGVTFISGSLFARCTSLKTVTIPSSVTIIYASAFSGCSALTSVSIPSSVTTIGENAFQGCTSLSNVIVPESVTSIGDYAFKDCSSLVSITIPSNISIIGYQAFIGTQWYNNLPDGLIYLGRVLTGYKGDKPSGEIAITVGTKTIGTSAFSGCSDITSILIPESVTNIGNSAFKDCTGLTSITIPSGVTSIGDSAFSGCTGFTSITSLIQNPFRGVGAFDNSHYKVKLYVPKGTKLKYLNAWPSFMIIEEIKVSKPLEGDVNCDKAVDVADIASVIDVMARSSNDFLADVNKDGAVDVADIATVISFMAGEGIENKELKGIALKMDTDVLYASAIGDSIKVSWADVKEQIINLLKEKGFTLSNDDFDTTYTLDNRSYVPNSDGSWKQTSEDESDYISVVFNPESDQIGMGVAVEQMMALLSKQNDKGEYIDSLGNVVEKLRDRDLKPFADYTLAVRFKSIGNVERPDVFVSFNIRVLKNTAMMKRPSQKQENGSWYSVLGLYDNEDSNKSNAFVNANIDAFNPGYYYAYDVRRLLLNLQLGLRGQQWLASSSSYSRAFDFLYDSVSGDNAAKRIGIEKAKLRELHGSLYFYTTDWEGDLEEGTPYWHDAQNTSTIADDKFYADRYLIKACYTPDPHDMVNPDGRTGKLGKYLFAYKYNEKTASYDMANGQMIAYIDSLDTHQVDNGSYYPYANLDRSGRPNESVMVHFCYESTYMRDLLNRAGRYAENNGGTQDGYSKATDNPFTTHVHLNLFEDYAGDNIPVKLTNPDFCIRTLRPINVEFQTPWQKTAIDAYEPVNGSSTVTITYKNMFRSQTGSPSSRVFPMDWRNYTQVNSNTDWIAFYQGKKADGQYNVWNTTPEYSYMLNDRSSYNRESDANFFNWNRWYYQPSTDGQYADSWNSMNVVPQVDHMLTNYGGTEGFWSSVASKVNMQITHTSDPVTGNIESTTFSFLTTDEEYYNTMFDIIIPVTVKYAWGDITTTGNWEPTNDIQQTNDRYFHNANMNYVKVHFGPVIGN